MSNLTNYTIKSIGGLNIYENEITEACFEWCKVQHYANDFQAIWIVGLAFMAIGTRYFIISILKNLNTTYEEKQTLLKFADLMNLLCFLLLTGFMIYFLWFK